MAICKTCRYARLGLTNPMEGYCLYGSEEISAEESTTGQAIIRVPGRMINLRDEACEHYEKKPSHKEVIRETN